MPNRYITFLPDVYYHIFNRSLTKDTIFLEDKDYKRFFETLLRYEEEFRKYGIKVKAFCIMPNHFHLLVKYTDKAGIEDNVIMKFMHRIQTSYAMYFKSKYKDSRPALKGQPLFDGRYKVKIVDSDKYIYAIINYIQKNSEKHLNISYKDWKYRSDVKLDGSYEDIFEDLEDYILEI